LFRATSSVALSLVALLYFVGCSSEAKGPKLTEVKGTVTLDEKPMASGDIMFVLGDHVSMLPVKDGAFSGQAGVGDSKIQIFSYRTESTVVEMAGEKVDLGKQNIVPDRFNVTTTLKANVAPSGPNEFKFDVTSM